MFNAQCEELYSTIRKLRREAKGFLTARDKQLLAEFNKSPRGYLAHVDVFEMVKGLYDRRQRELKDRALDNNGIIDTSKVTDSHLDEAGISRREWDHIKLLLAADPELFRPSEFGSFSPHSMIVDVSKYEGKKLSKEVKEILYRPPKVRTLYEKYWQLAKIVEDRTKTEYDADILKGHKPRYPVKSPEEIKLIDELL